MVIDGKTKILGIIGDPVSHSLSPAMQNAAIADAGINAVYVPFHVAPLSLEKAVAAIRSLKISGVNVTVPHKEAVIPFLDEIDQGARLIGAVNTIVNRNDRLIGYNTDGKGLIRSLEENLGFQPGGKNVVILGAGGAARAAVVALAQAGVGRVVVLNRTRGKAEGLAAEFSSHFPAVDMSAGSLVDESVAELISGSQLMVNTTTVGLHGETFDRPLLEHLPPGAVFYDMVYASGLTPLQQIAEKLNVPSADGRGMLVGQGEEAFSLWFGVDPPAGVMRVHVKK